MNKEDRDKLLKIRNELIRIRNRTGINFVKMPDDELLKWLALIRQRSE